MVYPSPRGPAGPKGEGGRRPDEGAVMHNPAFPLTLALSLMERGF